MYKAFLIPVGLAALAAASPASAVTAVAHCESGTTCAIAFDGTAGTFRNSEVDNPSFTDIFTFDLRSRGLLNLTLSTSFPGVGEEQDIDFSQVRLTGPGGVDVNLVNLAAEPVEFFARSNIAVAAGQYTLALTGTAGNGRSVDASYAGTLNFASGAVPEPASWALMMLGFGLVGAAARGRRRIARVAA